MPFNMHGVSVEAVIETGAGAIGLDDTINGQPSIVRKMVQSISEINVEMKMRALSSLEITMTPTYDDAVEILRSGLMGIGFVPRIVNVGGSTNLNTVPSIRVRIGYDSLEFPNRSPWFVGGLGVPGIEFGEEIQLTMKAHSGLIYGQKTEKSIAQTRRVIDLLQDLANMLNLTVIIRDQEALTALSKEATIVESKDLFNIVRDALYRLNIDFYMASLGDGVATDSLVIISKSFKDSRPPKWRLVMYEQIEPDKQIIPIERFSVDASSMVLPGASYGTKILAVNSDTKQKIVRNKTAKDTGIKKVSLGGTVPSSGLQKSAQKRVMGGGLTRIDETTDSGEQHMAIVRGSIDTGDVVDARTAYNTSDVLQFSITCPGIPAILPEDIVEIRIGGIEELSGLAQIQTVNHRVSDSFTTDLECSRSLGTSDAKNTGVDVNIQRLRSSEDRAAFTIRPRSV